MALEGVRVGPLDPDRGEMFGQVGGTATARQLIRHHMAMHPPALLAALSRVEQPLRSQALDREEVVAAVEAYYDEVGEALPEGAQITGANVRGQDDGDQQFVSFTWVVPPEAGGSGRSGKGMIPYDAEHTPNSLARGNDAVRISKLKEAGLPWSPDAVREEVAGLAGTGVAAEADPGERRRLLDENAALHEEMDELRARLAEIEGQRPSIAQSLGGGSGVGSSPMTPEGGSSSVVGTRGPEGLTDPSPGLRPNYPEPWPGYEGENAHDVAAKLREEKDRELTQNVLAYEQAHANRKVVVSAAQQILDRA